MDKTTSPAKYALILCILIVCALMAYASIDIHANERISSAVNPNDRVYRTEQRNVSTREPCLIPILQPMIFDDASLIFKGKYARSEHYTIVQNDGGFEYEEYYSVLYFDVVEIYDGDFKLINTTLPVTIRNYAYLTSDGKKIWNFGENSDFYYYVFCEEIPANELTQIKDRSPHMPRAIYQGYGDTVLATPGVLGNIQVGDTVPDGTAMRLRPMDMPQTIQAGTPEGCFYVVPPSEFEEFVAETVEFFKG